MADQPLVPEDVASLFPLGDARLKAIHWVEHGVAFDLDLMGSGPIRLLCDWATDVSIDLEFEDLAEGLLWEGKLKPVSGSQLQLDLDFGGTPKGGISLKCNRVSLEGERAV